MDELIWLTFQRLDGIAALRLHNLTVERLEKLTDCSAIGDLIDMGLIALDQGQLVVVAALTEELADFVTDELLILAQRREGGQAFAKAAPLVGQAVFIADGITIH